jgi:flavin-dependent dehydrogenase
MRAATHNLARSRRAAGNQGEWSVSTPVHLYDVAIVGAGPAGSAAAIHLARAGWSVVLVDRAHFPRDKPCAENVSPAAEPLLRELGVADDLAAAPIGRLRGFRVFAPNGTMFQGDFAATRDASGQALFEMGLVVPRLCLDHILVSAARQAGAVVREGWRLALVERSDGKLTGTYRLQSTNPGEIIHARLLVAADGVHSTVARRLGLHEATRMRKIALVAHARGISGISEYTEMHVAGRRYVGIAPLEPRQLGDLCNVAMVVDEVRDGRALAGRPTDFFLEALATFPQLRARLGSVTLVRPVLTTSRLNMRVRRLSGDGVLLVGDAAGYYDPFTGEGIYRALHSAQLAAVVAGQALASGDLSGRALAQYDRVYREAFRGKRLIEAIIQSAVQMPPLMDHVAGVMRRRKVLADIIVAVTGDFLPPTAVLRPSYLLRLLA